MGIFLTAADILLLYDLRLDPASVLKPQARRHFVGGNINTALLVWAKAHAESARVEANRQFFDEFGRRRERCD